MPASCIARALIAEPNFLLMDEPFGALDALTRAQMHEVVLDTWDRLQSGILFITHDVEEALLLGQAPDRACGTSRPHRARNRLDFGRRLVGGERTRSVRSDPDFVRLREDILDLVFEPGQAA